MSRERHPGARAAPTTGAGAAAAAQPGRRAATPFPVPPPPPKWAPRPAHRAAPKRADAGLDVELARAKALSRLRKHLEAACGAGGLALSGTGLLTFERYVWAARADAGVAATKVWPPRGRAEDAVLPPTAAAGVAALSADLQRRGAAKADADKAAAALGADASAAAAKLAARARALSTGAAPRPFTVAATPSRWSVELTAHSPDGKQAAFARLSRGAYVALAERYRRDAPPWDEAPPPVHDGGDGDDASFASPARLTFHTRLLTLLIRYRAVGGPGFHAAIGAPVVDTLRTALSTGLECFASALNAATQRFGTAFPDVDAPFGGVGDFFWGGCLPAGAAVTLNPPFEPATLARAAGAVVTALKAADAAGTRLTAAFVCPAWRDGAAWPVLTKEASAWAATPHPTILAAADHGFRDGTPHQAVHPHRASPYDTAVFVYQSRAQSGKRAIDVPALDSALRRAFAACVPTAAASEKQAARRGSKDVRAWSGTTTKKRRVEAGDNKQATKKRRGVRQKEA